MGVLMTNNVDGHAPALFDFSLLFFLSLSYLVVVVLVIPECANLSLSLLWKRNPCYPAEPVKW